VRQEAIDNPDWETVRAAVLELNQADRTEIGLRTDKGIEMMIGGGNGRFHVTVELSPSEFWVLTDPVGGDGRTLMMLGGQATPLAERYIVAEDQALSAAEEFVSARRIDPSLGWTVEQAERS
jgi:hypothetical protein